MAVNNDHVGSAKLGDKFPIRSPAQAAWTLLGTRESSRGGSE